MGGGGLKGTKPESMTWGTAFTSAQVPRTVGQRLLPEGGAPPGGKAPGTGRFHLPCSLYPGKWVPSEQKQFPPPQPLSIHRTHPLCSRREGLPRGFMQSPHLQKKDGKEGALPGPLT